MKLITYVIGLFSLTGFISCASNIEYLTVASKQANCMGVAPQKCLQIKENNSEKWTYLYQNIEGFNYQEGNEYVLKVKKEIIQNPPSDGSSIKYVMVKEISNTKIKKSINQSN